MEIVIVNNTTKCVKAIGWKLKDDQQKDLPQKVEGKKVENPYTLMPGYNEMPEIIWKNLQKHSVVKKWIDKGEIVLKEKTYKTKEDKLKNQEQVKDSCETLSSYSQKEAIEIVKKTLNIKNLEDWRNGEGRNRVLKAIDDQIEKLNSVDEDQDENSDNL